MTNSKRIYENILQTFFKNQCPMLFLMGPRQVGKTTLSKALSKKFERSVYFNWDIDEHRALILSGQKFIETIFPPQMIASKPLVIFDELHKYKNWKNFIKGFYDLYKRVL